MNVNRPHAAKGNQPSQHFQEKAEDKRWQIDNPYGVKRIQGMLPVGSQPIQVLRTVVDFVELPRNSTRCCSRCAQ